MSKRFVLFLLIIGLLTGAVSAQSPSEVLADLDEMEETVFQLKNNGQYQKAQGALLDGLIQLTRSMTTASEALEAELGARGECYLEMLYILAESTARFEALDEVLAKVTDQDPILFALCQHIRMRIQLHQGNLDKARSLKSELGYIDTWHVIGPFNNERGGGFDTAYGPEEGVDLKATYPGKERDVTWRINPCDTVTGYIDLDALFTPNDQALAYALAILETDGTKEVALHLGSDEAVKVMLNGRTVHASNARRLRHYDQNVVGLRLETGMNALMLKVCDQTGPWGFSARLTSLSGGPVKNVRVVTEGGKLVFPEPEGEPINVKAAVGAKNHFEERAAKGHARAHLYLGFLHHLREYEGENSGLAIEHLDNFLADQPNHVYGNYLKALASTRRYDIAAERDDNAWRAGLERTLALDPKNVEAHVKLGHFYLSSISIPDDALAHAKAAAKVNADYLPASYLYADAYKTKGMFARSRKAVRDLSHKADHLDYPGLRIRLGDIAQKQRKIDEAVNHWTTALKLNFLAGEARSRLIDVAAESGNQERVKSLLQEQLALNPYDKGSLRILATMALADENTEEVVGYLERILEINPDDDGALKGLGDVRHMQGENAEALEFYKKALETNPKAKALRRYVEFLFEDERPFEDEFKMNVQTLVAAHPQVENPDNDSHEYLLLQNVIKVNVDGTSSHYHHRIVRVLNQQGAKRFDYFVTYYAPGEQRCRIKTARIIHPDGSVEEAKIDNVDLPRIKQQGDMLPAYVDLPPLKSGDLVDIEYRTDDLQQSFFGDYFGYKHYFQEADLKAAYESRLVLILPASREFYFNQSNTETLPELTNDEAGDRRIHSWALSSIEKIDREREMPGRSELVPYVEVSTYESWDDFGSWWWNLVEQQLDVNDEMRGMVAQLTEGLSTDLEKIRAIYNFVVSDIRYNDTWEFGVHGFKPYRATAIFNNRFGDCKDKSILMKAMLKQVGVDCYPVLIRADLPRSKEDLTLPMVSHFNHVISYIPEVDGEEADLFLDGTAQFHVMESLPEMDHGATVFVVKEGPGKIKTIPYPRPVANASIQEFNVHLNADGSGVIDVKNQTAGFFDVAARQRFLNPGKRAVTLEKLYGSVFGDVVVDEEQFSNVEDLGSPVKYSAKIKAKDIMQVGGGRNQLRSVLFPMNMGGLGAEEERNFDLLLGVPFTLNATLYYHLPEGWSAPVLPPDTELDSDVMTFMLTYKKTSERTVKVKYDTIIKTPRIASGGYPAFRDLCREAERAQEKLIQITRDQ